MKTICRIFIIPTGLFLLAFTVVLFTTTLNVPEPINFFKKIVWAAGIIGSFFLVMIAAYFSILAFYIAITGETKY